MNVLGYYEQALRNREMRGFGEQFGPYTDTSSWSPVVKLQKKLGVPGTLSGRFDGALVDLIDAYAGSMPTNLADAQAVFTRLNTERPASAGNEGLNFTDAEITALATAYLAYKDAHGSTGYWMRKNAGWIIGGVVVVGAVIGGVWYWKRKG